VDVVNVFSSGFLSKFDLQELYSVIDGNRLYAKRFKIKDTPFTINIDCTDKTYGITIFRKCRLAFQDRYKEFGINEEGFVERLLGGFISEWRGQL
jgi:hypothetical protein